MGVGVYFMLSSSGCMWNSWGMLYIEPVYFVVVL